MSVCVGGGGGGGVNAVEFKQFSIQHEPTVSSHPLFLLKRESAGVDCIQRASFITSSMVWLVHCRILVPLQLMGWSSDQACSANTDLPVWHLTQASLCSLSLYTSEAALGFSNVMSYVIKVKIESARERECVCAKPIVLD